MPEIFAQEQTFDKAGSLSKGEYENCTFKHCNLADTDLSGYKFIECTFNGCNLSMAKVRNTAFQEVVFKDCKLLGLRFDVCNPFNVSFSFEGCLLNHASFFKMKLKKTLFRNTQLHETDFSETDLTNATFDNCDLLRATFERTLLEKADFRTAFNYTLDPENNKIKKARFSLSGISGLLDKYGIEIENS